jgi:catechol 2,3-dioxygenase-like lactoylglutathione lyase family enzyme
MFQLKTYAEVVISVRDLEATAAVFTQMLGWEVVLDGCGTPEEVNFWQLAPTCTTRQRLLRFQQQPFGQIRLVQFEGVLQRVIRSGGQTWDTGGILDIDLRVSDIEHTYRQMEDQGWQAYAPIATAIMGPFTVQEVLMKGPDGVVIAFVHRQIPPHPNPFGLNNCTSNVYLTAMVVKDLKIAHDFFVNKLGFILHNEIEFSPDAPERTMFGMPHSIAPQVRVKLQIIGPEANRDGLLDLVQLEWLRGEDFSELAKPPNRGILMYRFPVSNLKAYYAELIRLGVSIVCPINTLWLEPYGKVQIFALRSPDGVWIEFFEPLIP